MEINAGLVGGIVGVAYISASLLLWRFPALLHRRKLFRVSTLHCSHRGGAAENLENTMAAFRHAVKIGTDLLELDCQLTKDGKVVVAHDCNLLRLTGMDVNTEDVLYKDLPSLKPELWLHFDSSHIAKGEDRSITLLEDVFREFPEVAINIDLKEGSEKLIVEVDRLIRKYNRTDLCIWGGRQERIAKRCYEINPDVPLIFSFQRVFFIITTFYLGLLPFIPLREGFLEIPYYSIYLDLMPPAGTLYDMLVRFCCRLVDWIIFNRFFFLHLDRRGIRVLVWVLQKEEHWDLVLKTGAHGIMTDFPTKLKDYLIAQNFRFAKNNVVPTTHPLLSTDSPSNVIRRAHSRGKSSTD